MHPPRVSERKQPDKRNGFPMPGRSSFVPLLIVALEFPYHGAAGPAHRPGEQAGDPHTQTDADLSRIPPANGTLRHLSRRGRDLVTRKGGNEPDVLLLTRLF